MIEDKKDDPKTSHQKAKTGKEGAEGLLSFAVEQYNGIDKLIYYDLVPQLASQTLKKIAMEELEIVVEFFGKWNGKNISELVGYAKRVLEEGIPDEEFSPFVFSTVMEFFTFVEE